MFCSQCGAPWHSSALFCEDCGARSRHRAEPGHLPARGRGHSRSGERGTIAGYVVRGKGRGQPFSAPALAFTMMGGFSLVGVLCAVATSGSTLPVWQQLPLLLVAMALSLWLLAFSVVHLRAARTATRLRCQQDRDHALQAVRESRG